MMNDDQIRSVVGRFVDVFLDNTKMKLTKTDKELIMTGRDLVVNVLQNLNDIAFALREIEMNTRQGR